MSEAKVFPMNTFVACLRGAAADQGLLEMLSFVTQKDVDPEFASVACALSKAWIYEQEPNLTKASAGDIQALGQKVAIKPLPEAELTQAQAALAKLGELKAANDGLAADKATLEAANKQLEADLKAAKAKLKVFEDQAKAGEQRLDLSTKKIDEHIKKLEDLMAQVEKVKQQGVVVAGGAPAAGGAAAADAGAGGAPATGGEPESGFGLGSNPFADANW